MAAGSPARFGYDRLFDTGSAKRDQAIAAGIAVADRIADAVAGSTLILSLVTADQALAAARETGASIAPGALFCDMNSVAPDTKRAGAAAVEAAGGRYVDVAVMAPVHPLRRRVPLLVGGPHADAAVIALRGAGFGDVRSLGGAIGSASAIKMIRSVMVKGDRGAVGRVRAGGGGGGRAERGDRLARRELARGRLGEAVRL